MPSIHCRLYSLPLLVGASIQCAILGITILQLITEIALNGAALSGILLQNAFFRLLLMNNCTYFQLRNRFICGFILKQL